MYLFGYGSLINIISAQKSFKRKLLQTDLLPVKIKLFEITTPVGRFKNQFLNHLIL